MAELDLELTRAGPDWRLRVGGELDVASGPVLLGRVDEFLAGEAGDLVLDLEALEFVDSSGMLVLLNAHRRIMRAGRRMRVRCRPGPVARAFELARLSETFGVTST